MKTLCRIYRFYVDGFRSMTLGRTLWTVILVKLFIIFGILRLFFFPDLLAGKSSAERADCVRESLLLDRPVSDSVSAPAAVPMPNAGCGADSESSNSAI